jgi:glyoxylase-like metal-dependent hydrolase (beta-lactamase superfamily II)
MELKTVALGLYQLRAENCFTYLVTDAETRQAALVDPRADRVTTYLQELGDRGLSLRFVIDTHTHADHLSGAAELRARTGADVLLSERATSEVATRRLRDGDRMPLGGHHIDVIASPGAHGRFGELAGGRRAAHGAAPGGPISRMAALTASTRLCTRASQRCRMT